MASLILHGDLNAPEPALTRPLYVRPLMIAPADLGEYTPDDRLLVDTLYNAIVRIKGVEGQLGVAPTVFLVNLSLGDRRRPFANLVSPLARLLDFLAAKYDIVFLRNYRTHRLWCCSRGLPAPHERVHPRSIR